MHTLVCKKKPEGAEGLLGQASWCESGRVGGRSVGRTQGGTARRFRGQPSSALSLEVWEHAIWAGWIRTNLRERAGLLPTTCATALYWTKCFSALPDSRLKETLAIRPARWL